MSDIVSFFRVLYGKIYFEFVKNHIGLFFHQVRWVSRNRHNRTKALTRFTISQVTVGNGTYGKLNISEHSKSRLSIGNYCSIAPGTKFVLGGEHPLEQLSSYPFRRFYEGKSDAMSKGDIIVGDDVWFGENSMVLSGVTIGQGAVVAAGAVVCSDIPPYAIVGGVPAKIIRYRFSEAQIKELLKIDFSKFTREFIINHMKELYTPLQSEKIEWIPDSLKIDKEKK